MAAVLTLAVLALLARIKTAQAIPTYEPRLLMNRPNSSVAQCSTYKIPVTVTSQNFIYNATTFENDFDVVDLVTDYVRKDANTTFHPIAGIENVTATYSISGTFCSPKLPSLREKTVLLATHGLHYDGRYWDSSYKPEEYSFVEAAIAQGYSVFYYDRLGTGLSEKVSGYTNQATNQVEIIASLAALLRNGSYTSSVGTPDSIVLVGHSFGSFTSGSVLAKYPSRIDAAVLTGIGYASGPEYGGKLLLQSFAPRIASQLLPSRFSDLDTGYLTFADIYAHVNSFFKAPAYDVDAAKYAHSIVAPLAIAEYLFLTLSSPVVPEYQGPVLVTTGEFDFPVCTGECYSTYAQQPLGVIFPKSSMLETYIHPGVGHGINFGKNATGFYDVVLDFLDRAGF